ncbi:putative sulfate exporter family transporter [Aromatoleum toluclasticum]|nr:putative sulfate exporter family transporter [Aromatoleum toluclasticum]MCC4118435.1 putative sulfate exporter family transporter [Aromatoleum toluclasticum]
MTTQTTIAPPAMFSGVRVLMPGFMLCAVIAVAATFVSEHYGGPQFLYALLLGIAFHFLSDSDKCIPGIELSAKKLVRFGVALLGARIVASDVSDLGLIGVGALVGAVVLTISFGLLLARILGLPPLLGLLSGGGTGICGISATLAISSTLPATRETERYTLLTAIGVAIFSTVAMVLYPLVVKAAGLSVSEAGLFLGGSIHDVAQVVGAGLIISPEVGDAATLAKMFRVAMLMPVVVVLALVFHAERKKENGGNAKKTPILPLFLLAFAALATLNSLGLLSHEVVAASSTLSRWCLVISIAALGVKTSLEKLAELGWKPIALLSGEALFVATYMLAVVFAARLIAAH